MIIGKGISPFMFRKRGAFDANALEFFTAAGITDATQKSAYNTLVVGLKAANLYTKFYALYPMLGGSATSHKFNAINPIDSDAAFRLSFSGGWTHSSMGALPNGTNGYANTFLNANTTLTQNSTHLSYYSRTQSTIAAVEVGAFITHITQAVASFSGNMVALVNTSTVGTLVANATSTRLIISNRRAANVENGWRDGVKLVETANASTGKPNGNIFIGARNTSGTATAFTDRQCAFASIGDGFTDAEAATFTTLITNFQTTLGRNV